jgi:hypothetical protein
VATPIAVLALSVWRFIGAAPPRYPVALKGLAALIIWGALTVVAVAVFIMIVFSESYTQATRQAVELKWTIIFALICLVYALAGGGLVYWASRRPVKR